MARGIHDPDLFSEIRGRAQIFCRRLAVRDQDIDLIERDTITDGADIPLGMIQQKNARRGYGSQGAFCCDQRMGMLKSPARQLASGKDESNVVLITAPGHRQLTDDREFASSLVPVVNHIRLVEETCEYYAVIDHEIVWYGSMNLLSKEDAEDNLMRVCSKDIAAELLEMAFGSETEIQKW